MNGKKNYLGKALISYFLKTARDGSNVTTYPFEDSFLSTFAVKFFLFAINLRVLFTSMSAMERLELNLMSTVCE